MRLVASIVGLGVVVVACSSSSSTSSTPPLLPFKPSNISIDTMDLSKITDEDVSASCQIGTNDGDISDCFQSAALKAVLQSDGSKVQVVVVKSLRVEPTAHITVHGGLPLAIVSLGDFTLLGTIDGHAKVDVAGPGGFKALPMQKGAGPCGGAGGTAMGSTIGAAGGGGSACGVGGQGSNEDTAPGMPGPKTPACGTAELVPLVGGSSGGGGAIGAGGGGGAVQLVSGKTFTMGAAAYVNVGGGGGSYGGLASGQVAGGGGAGGSVLIEAMDAKVSGTLAANGGGGGGKGGGSAAAGSDGSPDSAIPAGGAPQPGGNGGAGTTIDGTNAGTASGGGGGGGAGAGRIRINTQTGKADVTSATISPATSTACVTQGTVKLL